MQDPKLDPTMGGMILLVDNNDSYTYNLFQLIAGLTDVEVRVIAAGDIDDDLVARVGRGTFSHIVISPGPGHPRDFAGTQDVIEAAASTPLLGVCLGHQGLGFALGADIDPAPAPRHGHVSAIEHSGEGIFAGMPQQFAAVRYHSLHLEARPGLTVHARAEDGVVMALRVDGRPHWGVQFHPESVLTEHGARLIANFLGDAASTRARGGPTEGASEPAALAERVVRAHVRSILIDLDDEETFAALAARHPAESLFWLDPDQTSGRGSRYSIMGSSAGGEVIRYRVDGVADIRVGDAETRLHDVDIFALLSDRLAATRVDGVPAGLPSPGYVGYLGYEVKALTLGPNRHVASTPDAYWIRPASYLIYDHRERRAHLVALAAESAEPADPIEPAKEQLVDEATGATLPLVQELYSRGPRATLGEWEGLLRARDGVAREPAASAPLTGEWRLGRDAYLDCIRAAQQHLRDGDSYEVCLTDTFEGVGPHDGLAYYRALRRRSPAPYAAYLRLNAFGDDIEIACASPERFLTVTADGAVETKPIKGTAPRSGDPVEDERLRDQLAADPKTRAENLMIVDLLRNDLGRVCEVGSVTVPSLMAVESFATVHQLVSTVRGTLRPGIRALDAVAACFPGGSMTGAPKLRTCEIIDELEAGPRGVYSGTIGYLGFDGSADLNIVIRTAVRDGDRWTVGAGGAIVLDSDPDAEHAEKNLKASALLGAPAGR